MRQIVFALSFALFSASSAHAIECLNGQSGDILSLESWELLDRDNEAGKSSPRRRHRHRLRQCIGLRGRNAAGFLRLERIQQKWKRFCGSDTRQNRGLEPRI